MRVDHLRITPNSAGIRQLLKSQEVADWVMAKTRQAADAAGPGFEARPFYGFDRVSGIVHPATNEAITAFFDDSTVLTRALGAVRDG